MLVSLLVAPYGPPRLRLGGFRPALIALVALAGVAACQSGNSAGPFTVSSAGPPPAAATAPTASVADDGVVATWEGGSLTYGTMKKDVQLDLIKLEAEYLTNRYDAESQALDEKVNDALLAAEATKRGMADKDALLAAEVEAKTPAPTNAEVEELYKAYSRKMGGRTLEQVRPDVEKAVTQRKQGERYMAYVTELRATYGVNLTLPYPDLPRFPVSVDDDPYQGNADAPVVIVQFAEFQCPYCGKAREATDQVLKHYEGKVKFVFRDFPLGFHDRAIPAAVAANCAGKQGKYWQVHDALMTNQRALEEADLERVARDAGVNITEWSTCRKDPSMEDEIKKDMADGAAIGVTGTPAFFINGVGISGAQPYERFKAIIDRELTKG